LNPKFICWKTGIGDSYGQVIILKFDRHSFAPGNRPSKRKVFENAWPWIDRNFDRTILTNVCEVTTQDRTELTCTKIDTKPIIAVQPFL
jgi:hypothetical protein